MNANNTNNMSQVSQDEHERAWELLPWLANGSLDEWSKSSVERHASECVACRRELELLRGVAAGTRVTDEQPLSAERSLAAMMERIDRQKVGGGYALNRWLATLSERLQLPRPAVVALQAVGLLLIVGAIGWFWSVGQEPRFHTLSTATESTAFPQPRVRVVFDDRLSVAEMGEILAGIHGDVVDGPSPHGVYTVEIESVGDESIEVSAVIEKLREHEGVRFAEPVGEGASGQLP